MTAPDNAADADPLGPDEDMGFDIPRSLTPEVSFPECIPRANVPEGYTGGFDEDGTPELVTPSGLVVTRTGGYLTLTTPRVRAAGGDAIRIHNDSDLSFLTDFPESDEQHDCTTCGIHAFRIAEFDAPGDVLVTAPVIATDEVGGAVATYDDLYTLDQLDP